jgi:hypothetical protein
VVILYNETEFIPEPLETVLATGDADKEVIGPAGPDGGDVAMLVGIALF